MKMRGKESLGVKCRGCNDKVKVDFTGKCHRVSPRRSLRVPPVTDTGDLSAAEEPINVSREIRGLHSIPAERGARWTADPF